MNLDGTLLIRRPKLGYVLCLSIFLLGVLTYQSIPRQENPGLSPRYITVWTNYPGASAGVVEEQVTRRLEDAVLEVSGLDEVTSTSALGISFINIELRGSTDLATKVREIETKVVDASNFLPPGVTPPVIESEVLKTYSLVLSLSSSVIPISDVSREAELLASKIRSHSLVKAVELFGEYEPEFHVLIHPLAASSRGVSLADVIEKLTSSIVEGSAGSIVIDEVAQPLILQNSRSNMEYVRLGGSRERPVFLSDIGTVKKTVSDDAPVVRTDGNPAVVIAIEMLRRADVISFSSAVKEIAANHTDSSSKELLLNVVADESKYVERRLFTMEFNLAMGGLLVALVTMFVMGFRLGSVLIIHLTVVFCLGAVALYLLGMSLNQISVAALILTIGLVIDEGVIFLDSIEKESHSTETVVEAISKGFDKVHLAVLSGAITTLSVFLPLYLLPGEIGEFIKSIPEVLFVVIGCSLVVSHTLLPLIYSKIGYRIPVLSSSRNSIVPTLSYRRALRKLLRKPLLTVVASLFLLVSLGALLLMSLGPISFFPKADRDQMLVDIQFPEATPVSRTDSEMNMAAQFVLKQKEVLTTTQFSGTGAPKFYYNLFTEGRGTHIGMIMIELVPLGIQEMESIAARFRQALKEMLPDAEVNVKTMEQGYITGSDIEVEIVGEDIQTLEKLSADFARRITSWPGIEIVNTSFGVQTVSQGINYRVGRVVSDAMLAENLARYMRTIGEGVEVGVFQENDEDIPVLVKSQVHSSSMLGWADVQLAIGEDVVGKSSIHDSIEITPVYVGEKRTRKDGLRTVKVSIDFQDGWDDPNMLDRVHETFDQISVPPGYRLVITGQEQDVNDSIAKLQTVAIIALLLVFAILVVRFDSFVLPLAIVMCVPAAIIGALFGVVVLNVSLGFTSILGVTVLIGIVVNDSIVMLEAINKECGAQRYHIESVVEGASSRLRAILITSITTMAGLLPLYLSQDPFFAPFAATVVGGLFVATMFSLFVFPCFHVLMLRQPFDVGVYESNGLDR